MNTNSEQVNAQKTPEQTSKASLNENIEVKSPPGDTASHKSDESEDYNPFEHRNIAKPTSNFGATAHILKTSLGSGILAMPMAYKNAGLVFGAVATVVLGVICTHCIKMLVRTSHIVCKKKKIPLLNFPETAEGAFDIGPKRFRKYAKAVSILVTVELLLSFILGNSVYVVFMSQSLSQVVEYAFRVEMNVRYYMLMLWIPLIFMCLLKTLKSLVPFSIIANILIVISFSITLYYIFRDINLPNSVNMIASIDRMPLFLATVIFAIEGIGTILPIENEMKNPERFVGGKCSVIDTAMTIVVLFYGVIGFFGYLEYGEETRGSITLNLPIDEPMAQAVKVLIALVIFFTYALQFYVPINIIWNLIKPKVKERYHFWGDLSVRIGLVTLTILIGMAVPNLEPIISLVGAICFSTLGLLIPAVVDTIVRWPVLGVARWRLIKNIFILLLSLLALFSGTYTSVFDIMYHEHED
ncbi:proton-coupled amino acid transporter, putative [Pediculus humanus corporis]|uniref:Proton-coupled amino acid transporter, putative n=1 Tax=Pediculus humanus subsp. corporis TaxID=121224 RepID=E0W432_PEDHC|nr:proton-coupled amino acid transporter, putative [Pediculus humanus corporis]EEB20388.1 proton-coupled amino acid transporter, putative [Pediculus humanus corporis]